ncbi:hypothetical protein D3C73_1344700 [compost metagenome]
MPEIVAKTLFATQVDELLLLRPQLIEQLAAGPCRVLVIPRRTYGQHRQLDVGQTRPPILVAITKAPEQPVPAHAFQGQANGLVLWAALEP